MLPLHHAPLIGGFSHLEFDVAVKRLQIHDQQEAIRLAKAGLLYWKDTFQGSITYGPHSADMDLLIDNREYEYANYMPHILVEEDE